MTVPRGGDDRTLDFYTGEAEKYAKFADPDGTPPPLQAFAGELQPGASVLDFGCGSAWAANRFRQLGFQVSAFDGSAGLAAQAKTLYDIDVTVASFDEFQETEAYDGIWASFCLLHDAREALPAHLRRLCTALRPNGRLYLGLIEGEGFERDGFERLYTYFQDDEVRTALDEAGFAVNTMDRTPGKKYDGSAIYELHFQAQRR